MTISRADLLASCRHNPALLKAEPVRIEIPGLRLISEGNAREHWAKRRKRKEATEWVVFCACHMARRELEGLSPPFVVRWTRVGKKLLDPDAVGSSFKHAQDELCRYLSVDDGDAENYRPEYRQEKGKGYAVRIEIVATGGARA